MKKATIAVTFFAAMAISLSAAPLRPAHVAADSQWILHLDLETLRRNTLGSLLEQRLQNPDINASLKQFVAATGFDPRTDLQAVTIYGDSAASGDNAVFMGYGSFDTNRLHEVLARQRSYRAMDGNGRRVHGWLERDPRPGISGYEFYHAAFPAPGISLVSRSREAAFNAIDVIGGTSPSLDRNLMALPDNMPDTILHMVFLAGDMTAMPAEAAILKHAERAALTIAGNGEDLLGRLVLYAREPATTSNILSVAEGMVSVFLLQDEQNPKLAEIARRTSVTSVDQSVVVSFPIPAEGLLNFLETAVKGNDPTGSISVF